MIHIRYQSWLGTALKTESENVQIGNSGITLGDFKKTLVARGEPYHMFEKENVIYGAINGSVAIDTTMIKDGDEVIFFSPIAGG